MSEFHFLRPLWLLALIPLLLFSWRFYRLSRAGGDWRRVCDAELLPFILLHDGGGRPARRASLLFSLGGLLAILALAGPVWERLPVPAFRNDAALVIALDLSQSMDAADVKPSRLERARFKIADILRQRKDGLSALLVYSGAAFTVTPLTDDAVTITAQLSALASDLMPAQGQRADLALELAGRLLRQAGLTQGDVLLISDGGSLGNADSAAQALRSHGYRVSALGVCSEAGAPVALAEGGFLQDERGNIVISKLAVAALRQLAGQGGGMYQTLDTGNADLAALLRFFGQQAKAGGEGAANQGTTIEQWEERGPWLLLALLPIAALAFRRGLLAVLVLLVLPLPEPAQAFSWSELWQSRDQQASSVFAAGDHAKAAAGFDDPAWKAAAQYKAGQYEAAAKTLESQESADAFYNRGNALAKQAHYPEAIAAYAQALQLDPANKDALENKQAVEKALQEQQKKQDKHDKPGKDGQQDGQQPQAGQDQQPSDSSPGNENKEDGQSKDQPGQQNDQHDNQAEENQRQDGQDKSAQGQDKPSDQPDEAAKQPAQQRAAGKPEQGKPDPDGQPMAAEGERKTEAQQADEQWLRRIPDDPGGLLRRKFLYQYQQRQGRQRTAP